MWREEKKKRRKKRLICIIPLLFHSDLVEILVSKKMQAGQPRG